MRSKRRLWRPSTTFICEIGLGSKKRIWAKVFHDVRHTLPVLFVALLLHTVFPLSKILMFPNLSTIAGIISLWQSLWLLPNESQMRFGSAPSEVRKGSFRMMAKGSEGLLPNDNQIRSQKCFKKVGKDLAFWRLLVYVTFQKCFSSMHVCGYVMFQKCSEVLKDPAIRHGFWVCVV